MAALTLSSTMYTANFIQEIWRVVRDFANIFFILVLLYAAFQTILGIGHGGAKKIIASVIVIALVVNFSLFFTKIVIDSSNILALIFYNKITVTGSSYVPIDTSATSVEQKDIAGSLVSAFNINTFFSQELFSKIDSGNQQFGVGSGINNYTLLSMMLIYGIIIGALTYAFFIAGFAFFGRMVTLILLLIVSPFAFVSYAVPKLKGINTIGFDSWISKLLETSFVGAIFMFIIYITSVILSKDIFGTAVDGTWTGMIQTLIMLFLPAMLIVILLVKGASYAKKASGEVTEKIMGYGKAAVGLAGGVALGAATGGAGLIGRATLGRVGSMVGNSATLKAREAQGGGWGFLAARTRDLGKLTGTSSFDVRGVKVGGKNLAGWTGASVGSSQKGGFDQMRKNQVRKTQERAHDLEVGEDEQLKQNLNTIERDLQDLLRSNSHAIEQVDKRIKSARDNARDAAARYGAGSTQAIAAGDALADLKGERSAIKNATRFTTSTGAVIDHTGNVSARGRSINQLEDTDVPHAHHDLERENKNRKWNYAASNSTTTSRVLNTVVRLGGYSPVRGVNEAAHKIRMEAKIPSKSKDSGDSHGGGGHGGGGGGGGHSPAPAAHPPAPAAPAGGGGHATGGHH